MTFAVIDFINVVTFFVEIPGFSIFLAMAECEIIRDHRKVFYAVGDSDIERILLAFIILSVSVVRRVSICPERTDDNFNAVRNGDSVEFVEVVEAVLNNLQRGRKNYFFDSRSRSGNKALYRFDSFSDDNFYDRSVVENFAFETNGFDFVRFDRAVAVFIESDRAENGYNGSFCDFRSVFGVVISAFVTIHGYGKVTGSFVGLIL